MLKITLQEVLCFDSLVQSKVHSQTSFSCSIYNFIDKQFYRNHFAWFIKSAFGEKRLHSINYSPVEFVD